MRLAYPFTEKRCENAVAGEAHPEAANAVPAAPSATAAAHAANLIIVFLLIFADSFSNYSLSSKICSLHFCPLAF